MNTKILSTLAAASVLSTALAIVFNALVLGLFAFTVCTLLLLIAATDYAPRRSYVLAGSRVRSEHEKFPLAA